VNRTRPAGELLADDTGTRRRRRTVTVMTDVAPLPSITLPGVANLRDVGGATATDGRRVRTGRLFRSGQLDHADASAREFLTGRGVEVVFDLRTAAESELSPDVLPDGVEVVRLDVLADEETSLAAHLADLFADPAGATALLRSGDIRAHYLATYRNLVLLDSARVAYRRLFADLADRGRVTLFHCTAGKDRTGWAAAALLSLLGVPDEAVTEDYLRSNDHVLDAFAPLFEHFAAAGGDPALLRPLFRVEPEFLDAARTEVSREFGSIEGYFTDGLGLGPDVHETLRRTLLADPA
jgi:protein-tyrosine phosphatase